MSISGILQKFALRNHVKTMYFRNHNQHYVCGINVLSSNVRLWGFFFKNSEWGSEFILVQPVVRGAGDQDNSNQHWLESGRQKCFIWETYGQGLETLPIQAGKPGTSLLQISLILQWGSSEATNVFPGAQKQVSLFKTKISSKAVQIKFHYFQKFH